MLTQWFPEGTEAYTVGYGVGWGKTDDPRRPQVLLGDPELFYHHAQRSPYSPAHFAFALCFEELLPPPEALAVFTRMVDAMVVGRRIGAIDLLAIQHWEPGPTGARDRTAVHGYISSTDFYRGRRLQLFERQSGYRIELAQELINQSSPYGSPKDPDKARVITVTTRPRTPARIEVADRFKAAVRLRGADQHSPDMLVTTLRASGAGRVEVDSGRPGRLAASFGCQTPDGEEMRARVLIRPGQQELLMRGSALRLLLGNRYERSPEVFEKMRNEFLTQAAQAMVLYDKKHGADPRHFARVMDWAHGLDLPVLAPPVLQPRSQTEDRAPGDKVTAPRSISPRITEDEFRIQPLAPPGVGEIGAPPIYRAPLGMSPERM